MGSDAELERSLRHVLGAMVELGYTSIIGTNADGDGELISLHTAKRWQATQDEIQADVLRFLRTARRGRRRLR